MQSEVGSPAATLRQAMREIANLGGVIRAESRFFVTPAYPAGSGPAFVNAAIAVQAPWSVSEALGHLHAVEAGLGRRRAERWGQRTLDLDLLAVDDVVRPNVATVRSWMSKTLDEQRAEAPGQLLLPHPRLHERAFVLVPLADIAPDWTHPITRQTVTEMLDALPPAVRAEVVPVDPA